MEDIQPAKEEGERFFEKGFEKVHAAVFFIDEKNGRMGMLKRAADNDFAPNLYTGVGGKVEKNEGHHAGIVREIDEELGDGKKNLQLEKIREVGRVIINNNAIVSYFALPFESDSLPATEKGIGTLEWVPFDALLNMQLIPTVIHFAGEWKRRGWDTQKPFTVFVTRENADDIYSPVSATIIKEGLLIV